LSLLINIFLFSLLPLVGQGDAGKEDIETIVPVNLVRLIRESQPPPEEEKLPEKKPPPRPLPKVVMKRHLPKRQVIKMDLPRLSFEINPRLVSGIPVAPPDVSGFYYDQGDVDQMPVPIFKMKPLYPYRAKRLNITGKVKVSFVVDEYGHVSQVKIVDAEPPGIFEDSVIRALPSWKFSPGKIAGHPVATMAVTTIEFNMEGR
jgi:protein TonB